MINLSPVCIPKVLEGIWRSGSVISRPSGVSSNLAPKWPKNNAAVKYQYIIIAGSHWLCYPRFLPITRIKEPSRSSPLMTVVLSQVLNCSSQHNFEGTTHVRKQLISVADRKLIVFLTLICKGSLYPDCPSQTNKQLSPTRQIKLNICIMNYASQHS